MMHAKHLTSSPCRSSTWAPWHSHRRPQRQQHLDLPSTPSLAAPRAPYQMQPFRTRTRRRDARDALLMPRVRQVGRPWTVLQAFLLDICVGMS